VKAPLDRTFDDWETEILRPMVRNLSTGGIVFLLALLNTQLEISYVTRFVRDYPLICRAEPT
jgi:hypothetical protein